MPRHPKASRTRAMIPRSPTRAIALLPLLLLAPLPALRHPAAAAAPPAPASAPSANDGDGETFYESIDVDVVNVEVVVSDRRGHPVAGLGRDDFELREDGKPVEIINFFASADPAAPASGQPAPPANQPAAPVQAAPASNQPAAPKTPDQILNFAVFVDNENLTPAARRPVLAALDRFFRSHVGTGDHVILANYDGGFRVSQPAASDPAALTAAVGRLMTSANHGGAAVQNRRRVVREQDELRQRAGNPAAAAEAQQLGDEIELEGHLDEQRGRMGLTALSDFITSLAGLPGRKALVVVSGAFAVETGEPLINRLAEHANTNRVTVYVLGAVEGAGAAAVDPSIAVGDDPFAATDALTGALHAVADRTGGLTAANLVDPGSFLETVRRDVTTYYSLGFAPAHKRDGKVHKLAVRVRSRSDVALRYRDTYEDRSGDQRAASETLSTLLLGVGENPLGVELSFDPLKPASGRTPPLLTVVVHVPIGKLALIPGERFHEGKLTLFVSTRDGRGRLSPVRRLAAPVHVANDKLMGALGQRAAFRIVVPLRSGEEAIAVGVRDEVGHLDSTASAPLGPALAAHAADATGAAEAPARQPGR
jgi:VWFA-related protein